MQFVTNTVLKLLKISASRLRLWKESVESVNHLAQIALCLVAIFGYFSTVRPVYQKELLEEQVAKKQNELAAAGKKIKLYHDEARVLEFSRFTTVAAAACSGIMKDVSKDPNMLLGSVDSLVDLDVSQCVMKIYDTRKMPEFSLIERTNVRKYVVTELLPQLEAERTKLRKAVELLPIRKVKDLPAPEGMLKKMLEQLPTSIREEEYSKYAQSQAKLDICLNYETEIMHELLLFQLPKQGQMSEEIP